MMKFRSFGIVSFNLDNTAETCSTPTCNVVDV